MANAIKAKERPARIAPVTVTLIMVVAGIQAGRIGEGEQRAEISVSPIWRFMTGKKDGWAANRKSVIATVYYNANDVISYADNPKGEKYILEKWERDEIMKFRKTRGGWKTKDEYTLKTLDNSYPYLDSVWHENNFNYIGIILFEKDASATKRYILPVGASSSTEESERLMYKSHDRYYGVWQIGFSNRYPRDVFNSSNVSTFLATGCCDYELSSMDWVWHYGLTDDDDHGRHGLSFSVKF